MKPGRATESERVGFVDFGQTLPIDYLLVDEYRILDVLGSGGFGITYKALDIQLDREVAIKEYFPGGIAYRDTTRTVHAKTAGVEKTFRWGLDRFIKEAQTLARLPHPNIVRVFRTFQANSTAYMVLEFVKGSDMEVWLNDIGRLPTQNELDELIGPILEALAIVHSKGILHRDIKPANIYIREATRTPVLLDFGAARFAVGQASGTTAAIVSAGYSPHESYTTDIRRQGPWTDIYAMAATLYRALSGTLPDEATSRMLQDDMRAASHLPLPRGAYRAGFLGAIDYGLRLLPKARPQSVADWLPGLLPTYVPSPDFLTASSVPWQDVQGGPPSAEQRRDGTPQRSGERRQGPSQDSLQRRVDAARGNLQGPGSVARAPAAEPSAPPSGERPSPRPVAKPPSDPQPPAAPPSGGGRAVASPPQRATPPASPPLQSPPSPAPSGPKVARPPSGSDRTEVQLEQRARSTPPSARGAGDASARPAPLAPPSGGRTEVAARPTPPQAPPSSGRTEAGKGTPRDGPSVRQPPVLQPGAKDGRGDSRVAAIAGGGLAALLVVAAVGYGVTRTDTRKPPAKEEPGVVIQQPTTPPSPPVQRRADPVPQPPPPAPQPPPPAPRVDPPPPAPPPAPKVEAPPPPPPAPKVEVRPPSPPPPPTPVRTALPPVDPARSEDLTVIATGGRENAVVTGGARGTLRIWDTIDGRDRVFSLRHGDAVSTVAVAADGLTAASGGWDRMIRIWSTETGEMRRAIDAGSERVEALAFLDPNRLAFFTAGNTLLVVDASSGTTIRTVVTGTGWITRAAISPARGLLAFATSENSIEVWSIDQGRRLAAFESRNDGHRDWVLSLAFSPDGKQLASGATDGTIKLWDVEALKRQRDLPTQPLAIKALAFSPDGKQLASGGDDRRVLVWTTANGAQARSFSGHADTIRSLVFLLGGRYLASVSDDGTVRLWPASS